MAGIESLKVGDAMVREAVAVSVGTSISETARILAQHSISGVPVLDEMGKLVGIVSEKDIVASFVMEEDAAEVLEPELCDLLARNHAEVEVELAKGRFTVVDEIMTRNPITVTEGTPLVEAARIMAEKRIHRLPVLKGKRLVGIITAYDIIRTISGL